MDNLSVSLWSVFMSGLPSIRKCNTCYCKHILLICTLQEEHSFLTRPYIDLPVILWWLSLRNFFHRALIQQFWLFTGKSELSALPAGWYDLLCVKTIQWLLLQCNNVRLKYYNTYIGDIITDWSLLFHTEVSFHTRHSYAFTDNFTIVFTIIQGERYQNSFAYFQLRQYT